MPVRSDAEVVSLLKTFTTKRSEDFPGCLIVTCPQEDCGEFFLVRRSTWTRKMVRKTHRGDPFTITGRPCPYCFRASHIPKRT